MNTGSSSVQRRLKLTLPLELANGVTLGLNSILTFPILLSMENIDKCIVSITYDAKLFKEKHQEIEIQSTKKSEERGIDITLSPISRTAKPTWIDVTAKADTLLQATGFFVTIV